MSASGFHTYVFPTENAISGIVYRCLYNLGYQPRMVEDGLALDGVVDNVVIFGGVTDLAELMDDQDWMTNDVVKPRIIVVMARAEIAEAYGLLPYCDGMVFTDVGHSRLDCAIELALDGYCTFPSQSEGWEVPQPGLADPFASLDLSMGGH